MRASPALTLTIERFTAWRVGLAVWVVATVAALSGWAWLMSAELGPMVWLVAIALACATGWTAFRLASTEPIRLAWDQQYWHCHALVDHGQPARGALDVRIDLGAWMMLCFTDGLTRKRRWIAVQRRGLEGQWHALRCAVYSPRPDAGGLPDELSQRASPGASQRASSRIDPAA